MGVYSRYKRDSGGFRKLVELLETTPSVRRQKMIDIGMEEDPDYTQQAMEYMMNFHDVLKMEDMELAEIMAKAPPRMIAYAILEQPQDVQERFLRCSKPHVASEVKDYLGVKVTAREIGGAQLKLVSTARELEKAGKIKTKRIPVSLE